MLYMQPVYFNESFFSNYFEISYLSLYRRKKSQNTAFLQSDSTEIY